MSNMNEEQQREGMQAEDIELLGTAIAPNFPDANAFNVIKAKIMARIEAPCPKGGYTIRAAEEDWFSMSDKIRVRVLNRDEAAGTQIALWDLSPGAELEPHDHDVDEECLVLEGAIQFGDHIVRTGDFHFMPKGTAHRDIYTNTGCLLYVKSALSDELRI